MGATWSGHKIQLGKRGTRKGKRETKLGKHQTKIAGYLFWFVLYRTELGSYLFCFRAYLIQLGRPRLLSNKEENELGKHGT